jgi:hypothetical protein
MLRTVMRALVFLAAGRVEFAGETDFMDLMPVQKLPRERSQLLPSIERELPIHCGGSR